MGLSATTLHAAIRGSAVFRDVPAGHFADDAIGEMYALGIAKGYDATTFGVNDPVTRGQLMVFLQRLRSELKGSGVSVSSASSRSSVSSASSTSSSSSSVSSVASSSSSSSSSVSTCSSNNPYNAGGYVHFGAREYNIDKNDAKGIVTIVVARTGGNQGGGSVDYTMNTGDAVADKDYVPQTGTLSFSSKETSKKISLQIKNNTADVASRSVNLVLKNPQGALKIDCPDRSIVRINDTRIASSSSTSSSSSTPSSPTSIGFSAVEYAVMENVSSLTVSVLRTGITTGVSTVNYKTVDGSGRSGSDYTATTGSFTFNAGETVKTFSIPIIDNTSIDGSHSFTLVLDTPSGADLSVPTALVIINDNEAMTNGSGSIRYSAASYTVDASLGKAVITIRHVGGTGPVSVSYATSNGTAVSGMDYTAVSGTLSFASGEAAKTFVVPVVDRGLSDLSVNLSLSNPVGAPLSDPSTGVLKLQ